MTTSSSRNSNAQGSVTTTSSSRTNNAQALTELIKQVEALKANSQAELESQKAWKQAFELKIESTCTNLHRDLQGSLRLASEGLSKRITDKVMDELAKKKYRKTPNEDILAEVRSEQGKIQSFQRDFLEHKASVTASLKKLEQLFSQRFGEAEAHTCLTGKIEDKLKQLDEKVRKDMKDIASLKEKVYTINTREMADTAGLKDMVSAVNVDGRSEVAELKRLHHADVADLKELAHSINMAQFQSSQQTNQSLKSLEERLKEGFENHEKSGKDLAQLQTKVNGLHSEILDLTAAVTAQARQDIQEKVDSKCRELQRDVEQAIKKNQMEVRTEVSGVRNQKQQLLIDKLPHELDLLKSGLEEQRNAASKRFLSMNSQIDALGLSIREEVRSRTDQDKELGERLDRKATAVENKLRGEMQKMMDDTSLKQREGMRDVTDTIQKLHAESLSRRLTEAQELIDERVQGLLQNLQTKTARSLDEFQSGMERQNSSLLNHFSQERASREAGEERLHTKIDNVAALLNVEHESLRKRCDNIQQQQVQRQSSVPKERERQSPPRQDVTSNGTFSWEDEARRLWEALDGHTHEITTNDRLSASRTSEVMSTGMPVGTSSPPARMPHSSMSRSISPPVTVQRSGSMTSLEVHRGSMTPLDLQRSADVQRSGSVNSLHQSPTGPPVQVPVVRQQMISPRLRPQTVVRHQYRT